MSDSRENLPGFQLDPAFGFDLNDESWVARLRRLPGEMPIGRLGSYELLAEIGRGGQGVVYKARQPGTGRVIAVKKVAAVREGSTSFRRRFEREIRTASALNHPHIVTIFGCDTVDGQPLLLMEYVEGVTLDRWTEGSHEATEPRSHEGPFSRDSQKSADLRLSERSESRRRPVGEVVALFEKICRAVAHAHQRVVIHRDLKPSNILVVCADKEGTEPRSDEAAKGLPPVPAASVAPSLRGFVASSAEPKVLDFGLARLLSPYVSESLFQTHTTGFVGTPAYASPEHFEADAAAVDVRSDIYAVGVMLFQALTGSLPHEGKTSFSALMRAIQDRDPPRPSSLAPLVPRELELIVLKALAKEKAQRYQSMDGLADDLRRFAAGEPVLAHPPTTWYQLRKLIRRHRPAFALSMVILLLVVGFAVTAALLGLRERAARQDADWNSYVASLAAASASLRANDAASAQEQLNRALPRLRNWEWRHFQAQADQSVATHLNRGDALAVDAQGRPILRDTQGGVRWTGADGEGWGIFSYWNRGIAPCAISPSLRYLAFIEDHSDADGNPLCTLSDPRSGRALARWPWPAWIGLRFAPDDRALVMANQGHLALLRLPLDRAGADETPATASSGPLLLTDAHFQRLNVSDATMAEIAFSPDGRRRASPGGPGQIKIVEVDSLKVLQTMQVGDRAIRSMAFSPDGRALAVGSVDQRVSLWHVESGDPMWVANGHQELISDVAFSPDGTRVGSASWDKTIRIWDVAGGACLARLVGHRAMVDAVAFFGDGSRLASVDRVGVLKTWNLSELRSPMGLGASRRVIGLSLAGAVGAGLLALSESTDDVWRNPRVSVMDLRARRVKGVLWTDDWTDPAGKGINNDSVATSDNGRWLAVGSASAVIRLWRIEDLSAWDGGAVAAPRPTRELNSPDAIGQQRVNVPALGSVPGGYPYGLSFDPEGRRLAVGRANGGLELWDVDRGEMILQRLGAMPSTACLCTFSPDGTRLAVQAGSGILQVYRSENAALLIEREGCRAESVGHAPIYHPAGTSLACSGDDNGIALRDSEDLALIRMFKGHAGTVTGVAFSPDGTRLVSVGTDSQVKLWDVGTGRELATLHGHESLVSSVRFIDADTIVSGGWDGVRFWDAAPAAPERPNTP